MQIDILTLFPSMFDTVLKQSIIGRAQQKGLLQIYVHNLRDYCFDKHKTADDYPYGGGGGMILKAEPIISALTKIKTNESKVILLTPQGTCFQQNKADEFAKLKHIILICGHYEEVDERIKDYVDEEISIGDYVLTGGEIPAMVIIDAAARCLPGALGDNEGVKKETFSLGLFDYPQYTRPPKLNDENVPEVLFAGNHAQTAQWRRRKSIEKTFYCRPDLLAKANLSDRDKELLKEVIIN